MDAHKDNLRRKMLEWATDTSRQTQVQIERSLYIPNSTMKEILTLNFNPGGILAEADMADLGLSPLICRARTTAAKIAICKHERALENSRRNRSMAEAEAEENNTTAYDVGSLPDDYNELLRCIGTFCALLHTLFGARCVFYRQCFALWTVMNSDLVYEQRASFSVLYCRQIVWAVLMESRVYFSQRLSVDDFIGVHPDDIRFPRSNLLTVVNQVQDMAPITRSSFPTAWFPAGATRTATTSAGATALFGTAAPVQSITAPAGGATPTVVSGITTGTAKTPKPPITIRASDIHPAIKAAMEAYIAKNKGVYLTAMLNHLNLTLEDLPTLGPDVMGGPNGICYNFILGRCNVDHCQHEHIHGRDVTDEFANDILSKLKPAITDFVTNGLPPGTKRRNRKRRRQNA